MAFEPHVELKQIEAARNRVAGQWRFVWALKNLAHHPLQVMSVRFPHQQFKSDEHIFRPPIDLAKDTGTEFEQVIHCEERTGLITENAFAIFYAIWLGVSWRIFVRLKVIVDGNGDPRATTELVTVQKAGFSGVES
jgi:hypothetical protein